LNLPSVEWDKPRDAPYPVRQGLAEADRAAASLRDHWGLGVDPIPNFVELLEERGIKVLSIGLTNIDGLTAQVRRVRHDAVPVIVVNRQDWGERQRFTLAHELGHMLMDVGDGIDEEKSAHRFAGAFLMPAEALWNEIGKNRTSIGGKELFYLKKLFGVSVQAITYRCKDLGIFSAPLFRRLFQEFNRLGWRSPPYQEPNALKGEIPTRFSRLTLRALSEGVVSEAKAAELLGLPVRELNQLMDVQPPHEPVEMAIGG
jgi:Zn-dependent peptidase ImmA (M78 family)